jgi:hypothetical protein
MRRTIIVGALGLLLGVGALEGVCRFVVGLGDPPLYVAHPTIEYMLKPGGVYRRFGHVFSVNRYGMRSDDLSPRREDREVRLLVLGDSVPNGGGLTDQDELASEIVKRALAERLSRPVAVGNISAGTWSPPNLLAYVRTYGTFDAELAVLVLNREDLRDFPGFAPLEPYKHPTEKPLTAATELFSRYLFPRASRAFRGGSSAPVPSGPEDSTGTTLPALLELIDTLRQRHADVIAFYHPMRDELGADGGFLAAAEFTVLKEFMAQHDVPFCSLAARYGAAIRSGISPFRDPYHPTAFGQALMARDMMQALGDGGWIRRWESQP